MRMMSLLAAVALVSMVSYAKTVYVDVNRPDDSGNGLTWETAKHTIQAAVDTALTGDTVLVAPGEYREGGGHPVSSPECDYISRVYINHGITLKSTGGAAVTHIIGEYDPDTANTVGMLGNGPKAVRCVFVNHDWSHTTVIEGFTLRDGAANQLKADDPDNGLSNAGGLRVQSVDTRAYLVDCVVKNCTGRRGGAIRNGRAVRTRFIGNRATGKGSVGAYSSFYFCVIDGNSEVNLFAGGQVVNCTIANNFGCVNVFTEKTKVYNTIAIQNDGAMCNDDTTPFSHALLDRSEHVVAMEETTINASAYQFFAPLTGDYRLLPTAQAIGMGSADLLSAFVLPTDVIDADKDFFGNTIDRNNLHAGAIQTMTQEPAGGALWFTSAKISIDGVPAIGMPNYIYTESYPTQVLVRPFGTTDRVFAWRYRTHAGTQPIRCPLPDDSLWFLPPIKGRCCTNELLTVQRTYWVDDDAAAGGDGSQERPFRTIQKAIDATPANGGTSRTLINVAEGVYDSEEDLKESLEMTNRVSFASGQYVRVLGAGEGRTIVKGKADPNGPAGDGRGPAAIRCVAMPNNGLFCVQNMTLTDSYANYIGDGNNGGNDTPGTCGGAVYAQGVINCYVADCTIANSLGFRGAIYRGTFMRCRITNSAGFGGGMRYSKLMCCVVDNMEFKTGGIPVAHGVWANQCTVIGRDKDNEFIYNDDCFTNMVVQTTRWIGSKMILPGSVVWDFTGQPQVPAICEATVGDPQFTRGDGDYIPLATSPVIGAGYFFDDYPDEYSPDRNGNPIHFVDGRPSAGAFQTFRSGYSVDLPSQAYGITMQPSGYAEVAPGESVTIAVDLSGAQRPCTEIAVDGIVTNTTQVAFTAPAVGEAPRGIRVTPVVTPHWYVDPNGSDDANGFTPETAKKTFKGVFDTGFVQNGDTIHAAEGRYEEKSMPCMDIDRVTSTIDARVVVPEGVTLVGAGRGKSFIVGNPASADVADGYGRGPGAVRCVFLSANTLIRGFTLTGGRTEGTGAQNCNNYGGGVFGYGMRRSVVVDCDIVDCASSRGGGGHQGIYVNCRFFRNRVCNNRAAASNAYLYYCVVDNNYGVNAIQNCYDTINCTFGPNNRDEAGVAEASALALPLGPVLNSLVLGKYNADAQAPLYATNCVFRTDRKVDPSAGRYSYDETTFFADLADVQLTEDFEPVIGQNVAIDRGRSVDFSSMSGLEFCGTNPHVQESLASHRIYNGAIDVGAVEADWRGEYAKALDAKFAVVTDATPNVTLVDGKIRIPDGESIEGTWGREKEGHMFTYTYAAQAVDGTLTGAIGDQDVVVTGSPEPVTFKTSAAAYPFAFSFVGTGYGSLSGWTIKDSSGTLLIFR